MIRKIKKVSLLTVLGLFVIAGCNKETPVETTKSTETSQIETNTETENVVITDGNYKATEENVKILGRSLYWKDTLWLSYSASGVEFSYENCNTITISLEGDSTANKTGISEDGTVYENGHQARFAVFVNGVQKEVSLMTTSKRDVVIDVSKETSGVISFVKLSESADSSIGITNIHADGMIKPTPKKDLKIEFIGDSITCGYGVEEGVSGFYCTNNENATKTYAYKTAAYLEADYSLVSFSGYGVYSAYSWDGNRQTYGLLPDFYDKQGNSYGSILTGISNKKIKWDFSKEKLDVIVINLGTNDASYCNTKDKKEAFVLAYVDFIKQIRLAHSDAKIVCSLGIMGADLFGEIKEAVKIYQDETKDPLVYTFKFKTQDSTNGVAVDYHPTEKSHEIAAKELVQYLKTIMD